MNNKQLLLKDLCARLPYGVKAQVTGWDEEKGEVKVPLKIYSINTDGYVYFETNDYDVNYLPIEACRLYLRPMSSMTEEEKKDLLVTIVGNEGVKYFQVLSDGSIDNTDATVQDLNKFNMHWVNFDRDTVTSYLDWLNAHHFDYRNLIEKGLAIEVTEENNPYKK